MSDAIEQPPAQPEPATEIPEPLSVADHAAEYSPEAQKAIAAETPEEKVAREHHSAQQRRERDTGKFADGKKRHRAASQQAGPEDAPRIQALTARAKAAEEKLTTAEAEVARLRTTHAPSVQIAKAEAKVEQAQPAAAGFAEPEPDENDPKFGGDYGKYLRAAAGWDLRKANYETQQAERQKTETTQRETAQRETLKTWAGRVETAKTKYPDFETVAFGPTVIPNGSVVDAWVMEHKSGADVLYYLQSHRPELDSLLVKPVLEQVEDLTLLSQRLLPSSPTAAGSTGSAPGRPPIVLAPRPPNPVRTEAQRAGDSPPPTDGSLSIAEHQKAFGLKRR